MPANTLDQRTMAQETWGGIDVGVFAGFITANFDQVGPTLNLTATNGAGNGTTPPAQVVKAGSNAFRGNVTFGSGTSTAAGIVSTILFPVALTGLLISGTTTPQLYVFLTPTTAAAAALDAAAIFTVSGQTVTGFTINVNTAPAASQASTVYGFNWWCSG